jgi:hypothetical protein
LPPVYDQEELSHERPVAGADVGAVVGVRGPVSDGAAGATLTKLEQAVKRAHTAYDRAERNAWERQRAEAAAAEAGESPADEPAEDLAHTA